MVAAESNGISPAAPTEPPTPPPVALPLTLDKAVTPWPAPGSFDEFASVSDELLQFDSFSTFEGVKFELHRQVTAPLNVSHVMHLVPAGRELPSSYSFAGICASADQSSFLVAKVDSNLDVFARAQLSPAPWAKVRSMHRSGTKDDVGDWNVETELTPFPSTNVGLKYVNQGQASLSLTQSIGSRVAVGTQVAHSVDKGTFVAAAARYRGPEYTASALALSFGAMWNFAFTRKVTDTLALSTDYTIFPTEAGRDSVAAAAWEYRLQSALAKAKIDTEGNVTSYVEELVTPNIQAKFSASMNHSTEEYKFGVGLAVHT
eukprot:CAMPEP_0170740416 /NCGR_PEP_ID=MMETSP0437-20130122/5672_1 /TAXON_ID=0 /ORGANISM="Sexangularia sp." /LENGTH=316 /DNA_ID=CAMNT_0011078915 /DNA_START=119 /DNA_END=1069 /DNA_ORIENTATION=+